MTARPRRAVRSVGRSVGRSVLQLGAMLSLCALALQLFFALRIGVMALLDPASTSFQRSEALRILRAKGSLPWSHQWADAPQISVQLKRAVIASEDASFVEHGGVDWDALQQAWHRNQRREARARPADAAAGAQKLVGGSTITQQLAKNLFLSGERTIVRKAQEFALTLMLEALLSKSRILELYLNHVEWGEGVFGVQAAARHYFRTEASRLSVEQAARLAVMLPAPKRFEKRPASVYLASRSATIAARMQAVTLP